MQILDAAAVAAALPYGPLVDHLSDCFRSGAHVPVRQHLDMYDGDGAGTLLLMPAWSVGPGGSRFAVVKVVTVFTGNGERGLPAVMGSVLLLSGDTGTPLALLDGGELTARRTAAASALAARHLARPEASTLLMVGTGRMALHLVRAHRTVRPLSRILIWGRDARRARALAQALERDPGPGPLREVVAVESLETAVAQADMVSCATLSREPLIRGAWLRDGTHLDLVGAYTPQMRETDAEAVQRSEVWVDTLEGARAEGGDLLQAEAEGAFTFHQVRGDLAGLCRGEAPGRANAARITLFKSVGTALEDLAAATMAVQAPR